MSNVINFPAQEDRFAIISADELDNHPAFIDEDNAFCEETQALEDLTEHFLRLAQENLREIQADLHGMGLEINSNDAWLRNLAATHAESNNPSDCCFCAECASQRNRDFLCALGGVLSYRAYIGA